MDCVFQLCSQFPCDFEFNEVHTLSDVDILTFAQEFLIEILDHLYACKFGTFLFNTEKERYNSQLNSKTESLWNHLSGDMTEFLNPFFVPDRGVLIPSSDISEIIFWSRCK